MFSLYWIVAYTVQTIPLTSWCLTSIYCDSISPCYLLFKCDIRDSFVPIVSRSVMSRVTALLKKSPQCSRQCTLIPPNRPFYTPTLFSSHLPMSMIMIMKRGHLKIREVSLTKLSSGWHQVVVQYNVVQTTGVHRVYSFVQFGPNTCAVVKKLCTVLNIICTQIVAYYIQNTEPNN